MGSSIHPYTAESLLVSNVFVSYAQEDVERVRPLAKALEAASISVFWAEAIPTGAQWREHITHELDAATSVVVVWSALSVQSAWVREEAEEGRTRKCLYPVFIDPVQPPRGFREIQGANLVGWSSTQPPASLERLIGELRTALGTPHDVEASPGRTRSVGSPLGAVGGVTIASTAAVLLGIWLWSGTEPSGCPEVELLREYDARVSSRPYEEQEEIYRRLAASMGEPFRGLFASYHNYEGAIGGFVRAADKYTKGESDCARVARLANALREASN